MQPPPALRVVETPSERGAASTMSVPGLMYCYGGALVGAGLLGLDKGVPMAGPAPLLPLSVGLGGTMLLFGYLSTPSGPHPPKKGEPGFGLCVRRSQCRRANCTPAPLTAETQVHGRGALRLAHAACFHRCGGAACSGGGEWRPRSTGGRRLIPARETAAGLHKQATFARPDAVCRRRVCLPRLHRSRLHAQRRLARGARGAFTQRRLALHGQLRPTSSRSAAVPRRAAWERRHVLMAGCAEAQEKVGLMRESLADTVSFRCAWRHPASVHQLAEQERARARAACLAGRLVSAVASRHARGVAPRRRPQ